MKDRLGKNTEKEKRKATRKKSELWETDAKCPTHT